MNKTASKVDSIIEQLENRCYTKTADKVGQYSKGNEIYFRRAFDNNYIVFSHFNKGKKEWLQGFDCWIGSYNSINEIGIKKAVFSEHIKLTFDFSEDWALVDEKIEEMQQTG